MTLKKGSAVICLLGLLNIIIVERIFSQEEITQENITASQQELMKNCETISFNSGKFSLKGFFVKPDSPGPYPVIIFNHGDSAELIDRTSHGVYWIVWKKFVKIGYACLSWDTPGTGESTGTHNWDQLFEERTSIVLSAIEYLKRREDVDPAFIGLVGHSQAGYIMPMVISRCDDVAFIINLSGPAMSSFDQGSFLIKQQLMLQGIPEKEAETYKNYYLKRARAKDYHTYYKYAKLLHDQPIIRDKIKWGNITPEEEFRPFSVGSQWNYQPYDLLCRIRIPVMAIFGENDHVVNAIEDAKLYEKALKEADNQHFIIKIFPNADHSLGQLENGVYRFAPGVFDLVVEWLSELKKTKDDKNNDWPVPKGPYLGQKPPDMTPEIFAPGIISKGYSEYQIAFTRDGRELYLWLGENRPYCTILCTREENAGWNSLEVCPFSGKYVDMKFSISPDGKKFFFSSNRPGSINGKPLNNLDVWYMERSPSGWGEPKRFDSSVNGKSNDYYPTMARNGNLYFMSDRDGGMGEDDIYISRNKKGKLTKASNIGHPINTSLNEGDPFISPDERYLIFCSRDRQGGFGNNDLYISFQRSDGSWTQAVNMGETINTAAEEVCPLVTHDGRYLFFSSNRKKIKTYPEFPLTYEQIVRELASPGNGAHDIYWVDARIIDKLEPEELK